MIFSPSPTQLPPNFSIEVQNNPISRVGNNKEEKSIKFLGYTLTRLYPGNITYNIYLTKYLKVCS